MSAGYDVRPRRWGVRHELSGEGYVLHAAPASPSPRSAFCVLLLAIFSLAACDTSIAPLSEDGENPFALFGYLDSAADTQFVRVVPLRHTPGRPDEGPAGVRAALVEVNTGARTLWRDSVVTLSDGTRGLLVYATAPVEAGRTYRLEVTGEDGRMTTAETAVPPVYEGQVRPVSGDSLRGFRQDVVWRGLRQPPARMLVRYTLAVAARTHRLTRDEGGSGLEAEGWRTTVALSRDRPGLLAEIGRTPEDLQVMLAGIEVEIEVRSAEWRAGPGPEDLVPNITNGRGFFGSRSVSRVLWVPTPEERRRLGYR